MVTDQKKISPELMEKAKACRTEGELLEFVEAEGIELPDELLEDVAGGAGSTDLFELIMKFITSGGSSIFPRG